MSKYKASFPGHFLGHFTLPPLYLSLFDLEVILFYVWIWKSENGDGGCIYLMIHNG